VFVSGITSRLFGTNTDTHHRVFGDKVGGHHIVRLVA
jgi:hypothetical protein